LVNRINCFNRKGAFYIAQRALPLFLEAKEKLAHPPTLIFTGATASVKGSANFAAFATGKFALRALAQSLAREFGPQGVHVSHAIIDGVIDIPRTKAWVFEHEDAKLSPDAVSLNRAIRRFSMEADKIY
jgi:NAD(P)-dependent dehydrogenase (short-subunit alcohol dehydrogenase family)